MTRSRPVTPALLAAALVAVVAITGCSSTPSFDRQAAVDRVLADGQGRLDRKQAECYVDRVADEVGVSQLQPGAQPDPSQLSKLTAIRVDCIGVTNLGRTPASGTVPRRSSPEETSARRLPSKPGDDAQLDLLYDACKQGNGQACDALFSAAPPGSEYEEFGVTCGGRTRELRCADVYGGSTPGSAVPSTTASTRRPG